MNFPRFFRFIILITFLFIQNVDGGSILSSKGVGLPFFHPNTRSMGMGGLSIAISDPFVISRINPAGLYMNQTTQLSLQYYFENNDYQDINGSASSNYSNFDGFTFAIPFGSGLNAAFGLAPFSRMDYQLSYPNSIETESYTKSVEGSGGLNTFSFSLCWALRSNLSLGLSGHYFFGKFKERWDVDYDDPGFISSKDEFTTKNWGFGLTTGFIYRPFRALTIGAIYTPEINLDNKTTISYIYLTEDKPDQGSILLPASWGVGTTFQIIRGVLLGIEYYERNWSRLTINDTRIQGTRDVNRLSVGGEILPNRNPEASFFKRLAFRLGFTTQPYLSLDPNQNSITEQWVTMGIGIPLYMNAAQIDIALSYGKRGSLDSNNLSENMFRISLSLTGGEKWFIRRY